MPICTGRPLRLYDLHLYSTHIDGVNLSPDLALYLLVLNLFELLNIYPYTDGLGFYLGSLCWMTTYTSLQVWTRLCTFFTLFQELRWCCHYLGSFFACKFSSYSVNLPNMSPIVLFACCFFSGHKLELWPAHLWRPMVP